VDTARYSRALYCLRWTDTSQNMKPAYEKVAKAFSAESDCVVAMMNADEAENKPIASQYGVTSFPTIKFFPKGSNEPIKYESGRSEEQFITVCVIDR
jgi:protein disulfide-isomerase A6